MKRVIIACIALSMLTACQQPGLNNYGYQDVGKATKVVFGRVVSQRHVHITGQNTGIGGIAGATGGALGGSYIGRGGGSIGGMLAGALVAGIAGHMAEQAIHDHDGVEYVITLEDEETITVTQNAGPELASIHDGDRVMVQVSGSYMRVLPAENLPAKVKKAKHIKVVD